ncbi:MAG: helix-turn-helix transcriptional regulator [Methylocella sp.]
MGAVDHLKTLCCLGLKPESAMIAVTPLLHEILPHGWSRMVLLEPDATFGRGYAENPETAAIFRDRMWRRFMDDRSSPASLHLSAIRTKAIGWTLHLQGRDWLDSGWYREIEAPLDSCWILDSMMGDAGRTFAFAHLMLTRPRGARPFTADDVQRLDRLRPWLAHAFRPEPPDDAPPEDEEPAGLAGTPVRSGQMILTPDAKLVFQTPGVESLIRMLMREPGDYTRYVPVRDRLPSPILKLLQRIAGAANGTSSTPPRMQVSTAHGALTLEAKSLLPAGTLPADAAKDPKSCLISVTIELREHAIAHAARMLRERGATPAQTKIGIHLALGKPKPAIADELGLQRSSVADHAKKLYQTLDIHNSTELATKIWLGQKQGEARQDLRRGIGFSGAVLKNGICSREAALPLLSHRGQAPG